jgi:hypothetical protein
MVPKLLTPPLVAGLATSVLVAVLGTLTPSVILAGIGSGVVFSPWGAPPCSLRWSGC